MPFLTICPLCRKKLHIPETGMGKKVRCPLCQGIFVAEALPVGEIVPEAEVAGKQAVAPKPGESSAITSRVPPRRVILESPREGDGHSPPKKGRRALVITLGGIAAAVVLLLVAAFLWPGFLSAPPITDGSDLLTLAPADTLFLIGLNTASARQHLDWKAEVDKSRNMQGANGVPPVLFDLLEDADRLLVAGKSAGNSLSFLAALLTSKPYDQEKIRTAFRLGDARQRVYKVPLPDPQGPQLLIAMPDSRLLVIGILTEEDFLKALGNLGRAPVLSAELLNRAREVEKTYAWGAAANQGLLQKKLQDLKPRDFPGGEPLLQAFQKAQGFSLGFDILAGKEIKVDFNLACPDPAQAESVKKFVQESWQGFLGGVRLLLAAGPQGKRKSKYSKPMLDDVGKSFQVQQSGPRVTASVQISAGAYQEMEKLLPKKVAKNVPITAKLVNGSFQTTDSITQQDEEPNRWGFHWKVYLVQMQQGKEYSLDLMSQDFPPYLRVFGPSGFLAGDNDRNRNLPVHLRIVPPATGTYRVIVDGGRWSSLGDFALTIREHAFQPSPFAVDPKLKGQKDKSYLTDMQEFGVVPGPWGLGKDGQLGDPGKKTIQVGGVFQAKGLSMAPPPPAKDGSTAGLMRVCYALGKSATFFKAAVALADSTPQDGEEVFFEVLGDNKVLWHGRLSQSKKVEKCSVIVQDVMVLELRTRSKAKNPVHAVWLDPYLLTSSLAENRDDLKVMPPSNRIVFRTAASGNYVMREAEIYEGRPQTICWHPKGTYLYYLDVKGKALYRFQAKGLIEDAHLPLPVEPVSLALSSEGLVCSTLRGILVLDPDTLQVKKTANRLQMLYIQATPSSPLGVTTHPNHNEFTLVDLKTGQAGSRCKLFPQYIPGFQALAPDGQALFLVTSKPREYRLHRARIQGLTLELDLTQDFPDKVNRLAFSPDGQLLCAYPTSERGDDPRKKADPIDIFLYRTNALNKPPVTIKTALPRLVCFGPKDQNLYNVSLQALQVQVVSQEGKLIRSYPFPNGVGFPCDCSFHPLGDALAFVTYKRIFCIEMGK